MMLWKFRELLRNILKNYFSNKLNNLEEKHISTYIQCIKIELRVCKKF
jgi:hypothetical protein